NIAEGTGRGSTADNRRFVWIARGSFYETKHWLRRAFQRDLLTNDQVDKLRPLVDRLGPLLNGYLRSLNRPTQASNPQQQVTNNE
ncbi:MAG: four helix bundle protein, partial [Gemmataceae bacterium]